MELFETHLLSTLVFLPLAASVVGFLMPKESPAAHRNWALSVTGFVFVLSLLLIPGFDATNPGFQRVENVPWIPALGVSYSVGVDGISLWLILLTTFLMPLAVLGSFGSITKDTRRYFALLLLLETGMLGAFVALDTFLFYVFWEFMLIPMYFLVGIWGGKERIYAAMKLFLYTMVGSLLMLVAIFYLAYQYHAQFGGYSLALQDLLQVRLSGGGYFSVQSLLFLAFALAFAIKVPLFPLHTWLPDAHVQAPTAGSVILAGILLKMGGYGFLRFGFPLFPEAVALYRPMFMWLGAIAIVYGACVALVQSDVKKLVAYSSVSHMGYVVLGLFALNPTGVSGSLYQMLCHGISTGGLFLLVGMIYDRRHTREISDFGGLARVMPLFAVAFLVLTLSSIALPGTNGFVGEFLILLGTFQALPWAAAVAGLGVILGAVYMLWVYQRVMLGPITGRENQGLKDLSAREIVVLAPLLALVFFMGLRPNFFLSKMETSVTQVVQRVAPAVAE
jgi:NADH-quinone oxidoreductase subunit M